MEDGAPTDEEVERQEAPHDFDADLVEPAEDRPPNKAPVNLEEKLDSGHGPETFEERMRRVGVGSDSAARPALHKEFQDELVRQARERRVETEPRRVRITIADLKKYGFTGGCPRCANLELVNWGYKGGHNEQCRARMYNKYSNRKMTPS